VSVDQVVTLMMGCPGAGKTTWIAANASREHVASTEPLRVDRRINASAYMDVVRRSAITAAYAGRGVIVDSTGLDPRHRAWWRGLAEDVGARTRLVICEASLADVLAAQRGRAAPVADEVVRAYYARLARAIPDALAEPWGEIVRVRR
jgi:predicted kinase